MVALKPILMSYLGFFFSVSKVASSGADSEAPQTSGAEGAAPCGNPSQHPTLLGVTWVPLSKRLDCLCQVGIPVVALSPPKPGQV